MKRFYGVIIVFFLVGCGHLPVSTDYDTSYSFASIKTYAWLPVKQKLTKDPYVDNDLMAARVNKAIDRQLAQKGYQKVAASDADVLVTYHLSSHQKLSVTSYHNHFGYYPCRHCYSGGYHYSGGYNHGSNVSVKQYRAGGFMIDFIDPEKRELLWRGLTERRLPGVATPQQRDAFVNETVTAIIGRFPPK